MHRSSADAGGGCCSIFNQGIDQDAPFKRWRLTNTYSTDAMQGEIDVAFCDQHRPCYRPGWQGQIRQLRFDVTGRQLRFEFWTDHGFGPVWLDLQRD